MYQSLLYLEQAHRIRWHEPRRSASQPGRRFDGLAGEEVALSAVCRLC